MLPNIIAQFQLLLKNTVLKVGTEPDLRWYRVMSQMSFENELRRCRISPADRLIKLAEALWEDIKPQ